jgi:hypothetical protein
LLVAASALGVVGGQGIPIAEPPCLNACDIEGLRSRNNQPGWSSLQQMSKQEPDRGKAGTVSTFAEQHPTDVVVEEEERVSCWRFEQFLQLGFAEADACLLSESAVDLNRARSLIGAGCPHNLALKIASRPNRAAQMSVRPPDAPIGSQDRADTRCQGGKRPKLGTRGELRPVGLRPLRPP